MVPNMGCFKIRSEREQDDRGNSARQKIWQLKKLFPKNILMKMGNFSFWALERRRPRFLGTLESNDTCKMRKILTQHGRILTHSVWFYQKIIFTILLKLKS